MDLGNLSVKIGAVTDDFEKGMSVSVDGLLKFDKTVGQLKDQLKRFQEYLKEATNTTSIARLNAAITETKRRIDSIQSFTGFNNVANDVKKTTTNFTGLTRVIQDLPFGFIAISNNLEQLLPAAGGLGLAFSGIVSALSFAQIGFRNWSRDVKDGKNDIEAYKNAVEKLTESTAKEVVQLRTNMIAIQDGNIPLSERKKAIEDLRKNYGEYLKNLSDEDILTGRVGDAMQKINEALKAKLMLQLLQEKITPIIKDQLELELKNQQLKEQSAFLDDKNFQKSYEGRTKLRDAERNYLAVQKVAGEQARKDIDLNNKAIGKLEEKIQSLLGTAKPLLEQSFGLDLKQDKTKSFTDIIANLRKELAALNVEFKEKFLSPKDFNEKVVDAYQKALGELAKIKAPKAVIDEISFEAAPEQVKKAMRELGDFIKKNMKEDPIAVPVDFKPVETMTDAQARLANLGKELARKMDIGKLRGLGIKVSDFISDEGLKEKLDNANATLNVWSAKLQELLTNSFASIGEGLAKAIDGGGVKSIFAGLLELFGKFLIEWGKAQIVASQAAQWLKKIQIFPQGSLVAGIAAVAAGNLLQMQMPKFAKGGMVTGATMAMVGDNPSGKEAIIPFERMGEFMNTMGGRGGFGGERLVAEISMDSLRFYLSRNENRYNKNR